MLQRLQDPVVVLIDGQPKTVGGSGTVTLAMQRRCLARMSAWCRLAQMTLKAEFPDWDALCAFDVFDLEVEGSSVGWCQQ
jgi:hypothetical protein